MSINITVAHAVPDEAYERIVALTDTLCETDTNFEGVPIEVIRGDMTNVALVVSDSEDALRETLLQLLVEDALGVESTRPSATGAQKEHFPLQGSAPNEHRWGHLPQQAQWTGGTHLDPGFQ